MKAAYVLLTAAFVTLSSCVTYRLLPQEDQDASIKYSRGTQVLSALKDQIGVTISSLNDSDPGPDLYFEVLTPLGFSVRVTHTYWD